MVWRRIFVMVLVTCLLDFGAPVRAHAAMISTDTVVSGTERDQIVSVFNRAEVRVHLANLGVNSGDVNARVAVLTDEEAARIACQLDELPTGGSVAIVVGVLAVLALVVVVVANIMRVIERG